MRGWWLTGLWLVGCAGVAPINTPFPAAEPTVDVLTNELESNEAAAKKKQSDEDGGLQISGKEVLTQRNDQGCVMVSEDGAELACVHHVVAQRYAVTHWQFFSVDNGAMIASYTVYDGPGDGSGVQRSELARVNERLQLASFLRAPKVMRADHQLSRILRRDDETLTIHWEGRSAAIELPDMVLEDVDANQEQWARCCQWLPIAVTALDEQLALMLRLDCRFTADITRRRAGCFVKDYHDEQPSHGSEVVIAPKP